MIASRWIAGTIASVTLLALVAPGAAAQAPDWTTYEYPWLQPDEEGDEPVPFLDIVSLAATTLDDGSLYFVMEIQDMTGASGNLAHDVFFEVDGAAYQAPFIATWAGGDVVTQLPLSWANSGTNVLAEATVLADANLVIFEIDVGAVDGLDPGVPIEAITADTRVVTALGHTRDTVTPSVEPVDFTYGTGSSLLGGDEPEVIQETLPEGDEATVSLQLTNATNATYQYAWNATLEGAAEIKYNVTLDAGEATLVVRDGANETLANVVITGEAAETIVADAANAGRWNLTVTFANAVGTLELGITPHVDSTDDADGPAPSDAPAGNQTDGNETALDVEDDGGLAPGLGAPLLAVTLVAATLYGRRRRA